jgi:hypothetical protein
VDRDAVKSKDPFEYGLSLVDRGVEAAVIESLLGSLIEGESDPWKKRLARAKRDAVLSIQDRDNPRIMVMKLLAYFDEYVRGIVERDVFKEN